MAVPEQLSLPLGTDNSQSSSTNNLYNGRELGTFKDSLRAPVYRWFRYPAGFSFKFIRESFNLFGIEPGDWVYDPFSGTGTTLVYAKKHGVNAYGVEAHKFVHWVADVKLFWEFDLDELRQNIHEFLQSSLGEMRERITEFSIEEVFPELIYKCYHPEDLRVLYYLRERIENEERVVSVTNFLKLALTETLRGAAAAGTGWPYIAPRKNTGKQPPKDAFRVFEKTLWQMYRDLQVMTEELSLRASIVENVLGDSRKPQPVADGQMALAVTSPPYLNNYDYADRTRLETYFWGITNSWSDITTQFRNHLMVAATTQIVRKNYVVENALSREIAIAAPNVFDALQKSILQLSKLRMEKAGKKDYDLMVALYFNDMLAVLKETYRLLVPGARFCLVLGDSAPYGVHIPTDDFIGQLGTGIGFRKYSYHELRRRGGKWKDNPQRHHVPLHEGIVVLQK